MPRSCFLPDVECSDAEKAEAERLCVAEGVDPRGLTTWTWTYADGFKREITRERWVAFLDAGRALIAARALFSAAEG